jgi:hypothetical protein
LTSKNFLWQHYTPKIAKVYDWTIDVAVYDCTTSNLQSHLNEAFHTVSKLFGSLMLPLNRHFVFTGILLATHAFHMCFSAVWSASFPDNMCGVMLLLSHVFLTSHTLTGSQSGT